MRIAVSLGLSGIGVIAIIFSATMANPLQHPIGPGYVPLCVSACMTALCVRETFLAFRELRSKRASCVVTGETNGKKNPVKPSGQSFQWLTASALTAVSLLTWSLGGYLLGMTASVFALTRVDRRIKPLIAFLYAVILTLSLWFLFEVVLKVNLG